MIEQILKDIFIIKVPLPGNPLKNINSYYIKGKYKNLLIDTGFNTQVCYDALKQGLDKLKVDMKNTDIFLTHLHADHVGLAGLIASNNTRIYISETDKKILVQLFEDEYWNTMNKRFLTLGFSKKELEENKSKNPISTYLPPKQTEYTIIKDDFEIDLGNYKFKSIETPGHTPGHMCLFDEEHKILFSGDHIIFDITPNITSWIGIDNSLGLFIENLKKIKKLDIETTLSAHRKPIGNCHHRIDELIQHHMERLNEVYQIVKNSQGITTYEVASKMTWSIRAKNWSEFPITQKWFAVGEASSHLEYILCEGTVKRELIDGKYLYYIN